MKKGKISKRIIAFLLALLLAGTTVPVTADAAEDASSNEETAENHAPALKGEAEKIFMKANYGTGSSSYLYFKPSDYFTDEDGDTLTYTVKKDGEVVTSDSESFRVEIKEPGKWVYTIAANDGKADSPVMTLICYGVKPSVDVSKVDGLYANKSDYIYVCSKEEDTFSLPMNFEPQIDQKLTYELSGSASVAAKAAVTITEDGEVTIRRPEDTLYNVNIYGKYGSEYIVSLNLTIYPEKPAATTDNFIVALAENADLRNPVAVNEVFNCWYGSSFNYTLEDPSIADIASGNGTGIKVTPKKLGTTKVTAAYKSAPELSCEFSITVSGVAVSIKDTDSDSVILKDGKETTYQMVAESTGTDETFTWTSSDDEIASIDDKGVLTAKKEGSVYIKAESSLSTEENPLAGGLYVQVKKEGKAYLDEISFENYNVFEGDEWFSKVSAFHSAKLEYDMQIKENNISTTNLYFIPTFDDTNVKAVLSYQVSGGDYQTMELVNGKKVNISNAYMTGPNKITIAVSDKADETNVTTYTFNVTRPYYTTNTFRALSVYPNGTTAITYPTYNNAKEGTLFALEEDGSFYKWSGFTTSRNNYKTYLYGKRTSTITFMGTFLNTNQFARVLTNGENPVDLVHNWATTPLQLDEDGETVFTIEVVSEKTYVAKKAAGEDPFETPETTYTVTAETISPLGIDAQILSAEFAAGEFYKPGFDPDVYSNKVILPSGQTSDTMTFTVPAGINVYYGSVSADNKLTAEKQDESGNNVYTKEVSGSTVTINLETVSEENPEETGVSAYTFTLKELGTKDIMPDRITEYLCLGSQYTNLGNYGNEPERTIVKNPTIVSLGNFGGYIVYQYDTPIKNDDKNPYGIDFTVYGNSFGGAGASEPGNVLVSKDGKKWYALAGSMHYTDAADWNYSMTYTKTGTGASSWTASDGRSGINYNYPLAKNYPFFSWNEENQSTMTVSGLCLGSTGKDAYGSASALYPAFGYVDVNKVPYNQKDGTAANPYTGEHGSLGDAFDLDWAVDENGMPVELDEISYIKVTTASNIYAGAIGEKSTEVATVCRTSDQAKAAVGKTEAPASIQVNGAEVQKTKDQVFSASYDKGEKITVNVDVPEGTNVYIDDYYGTKLTFDEVPEKKMFRIIAQSGEAEPYIAVVELNENKEKTGCIDTSDLTFTDITEAETAGYVNISFADNGIREDNASMEEIYRNPLGTFIKSVKVPFKQGENIPQVTLRLLNALNIDSEYTGAVEDGFYLKAIKNFTIDDVYYESLGEFDAGEKSGWMISFNNWFMDQGASKFTVEDGDVIKWQYNCQWGADIGNDWSKASAEITGLSFLEDYGTLAPEFDTETVNYTYTLKAGTAKIALEALMENYSAKMRCFVDGEEIKYRPMQEINIKDGSLIRLYSKYALYDGSFDTDIISVFINITGDADADAAYVAEAERFIDAIDQAGDAKAEAVTVARTIYNYLSDTQKALVTNYAKLEEAEKGDDGDEDLKPTPTDITAVYQATGNYLENLAKTTAPAVSSVGGEWMVLSLARGGRSVPEAYYTNVYNYVKANINAASRLHSSKSTDNSRVILGLTAAGYNVTNVAGYNLLNGLSDMDYLKKQGINGPIWALIALDSHAYTPSGNVTREALIDYILSAKCADGGYKVSGDTADADMTAMAVTALAPYYTTNEKVKAAVDTALDTLSGMQAANGGFAPVGASEVTCESAAQVVTALSALGIDADTDARFVKNGNSVLHSLVSFAAAEGGFKHTASGNVDGMATEQGYYALTAYARMKAGNTSLYNMSDVTIREQNPTVTDIPKTDQTDTKQDDTKQNDTTQDTELKDNITAALAKGTVFKVKGYRYKVTGKDTVSFVGITSKSAKSVTIPATVSYHKTTYKITAVANKALKGKAKLTTVKIGKNVKTIGAEAFRNCKKLKKITISSTGLKKVGKNAFKGIKANAAVKVPAKKLAGYKKLLKNKGLNKKAKITK